MRLLFLSIALLIGFSGAADAGPVGAAIAGVVKWAGASVIGSALLNMAISVGMSALSRALMGRRQPTAGIRTSQPTAGEAMPASIILGSYATAGNHVAPPQSAGRVGKNPNGFLTQIIDVSDLPVTELAGLWINDEKAEILPPQPGSLYPDHHEVGGKYAGNVWVKFFDGSQTSAYSEIQGVEPRPFGTDMIGRGVAYAVLRARYNPEVHKQIPTALFEIKGIKLYDPRRDDTVGGAGAHRWDNPATWTHSDNPAVMVYSILRGISLPDGSRWGGNVAASDLPLQSWFAAMNECDRPVDGQPQYRAGMEVRIGPEALGGDEPGDVIEELLRTCSGVLSEYGGTWKIRVGAPGLPVMAFGDDDIIITDAEDFEPHPGLAQTFNAITCQYPEPREKWAAKEAPPRYDEDYEAEDQGRRLVASLSLAACPYADQVQRVMTAYLADERRFRRHTITLPPDFAALEPLDTVSWSSARNGYTGKLFEVTGAVVDPVTLCVRVELREVDPDDYAWTPDMALPVVINPVTTPLPVAEAVPGFAAQGITVDDDQGRPRRPAAKLSWDADQPDVRGVRYEIRAQGQDDLSASGMQAVASGGVVVVDGIVPGAAMEARARLVVDRATIWSDWLPFNAPDIRIGLDDLDDDLQVSQARIDYAAQEAAAAGQLAIEAGEAVDAALQYTDTAVQQARDDLAVDFAAAQQAASTATTQASLSTQARDAAGNHANAASNSAALAGTRADAAGASATAANNARTGAETERAAAVSARNDAVIAKQDAESAKAGAQSAFEMSAQVAGMGSGVLTAPYLQAGSGWSRWNTEQGSLTILPNEFYPIGQTYVFSVQEGETTGLQAYTAIQSGLWTGQAAARGYVVEVEVTRSGSINGAGVWLQWVTSSGNFSAQIPFNQMQAAGGFTGTRQTYRALFMRPAGFSGTFTEHRIYVFANHANFGQPLAAKMLRIHRVHVRLASEEEMGSGQVMAEVQAHLTQNYLTSAQTNQAIAQAENRVNASLGTTNANVTQTSTALADLRGSVASVSILAQASGANAAGIEAVSINQDGTTSRSALRLRGDDVIVPGSLSASRLTVTEFGNLVPDNQFQDPDNWTGSLGSVAVTASTGWGEGAKGAIWSNDIGGAAGWTSIRQSAALMPLRGGEEYAYSYKMRRYNAGSGRGRMAVWYFRADGSTNGSTGLGEVVTNSATPQEATGTFTPPAGTVSGRVGFQIDRSQSSGVIFRSAFIGEKRPGTTLITPEGVTADLISADTMRALNGQFLDLAAANIRVGNAEIDTLKLAGNSVTQQWGNNFSNQQITGTGANQLVANLTLTFQHPMNVLVGFQADYTLAAARQALEGRLLVNGNPVHRIHLVHGYRPDGGLEHPNSITTVRQMHIAAGTHSYRIEVSGAGAGWNGTLTGALFVFGAMR